VLLYNAYVSSAEKKQKHSRSFWFTDAI